MIQNHNTPAFWTAVSLAIIFLCQWLLVQGVQPPLPCTCQTHINSPGSCACASRGEQIPFLFSGRVCVWFMSLEKEHGILECQIKACPANERTRWNLGAFRINYWKNRANAKWCELTVADPASFRCKGIFVHGSGFSSRCWQGDNSVL